MIINDFEKRKLINTPSWLSSNVHYLTIMGSVAYGVFSDTSDVDIYGFCIPPKEYIFPHTIGKIHGFGRQNQTFDQWQQHHVIDKQAAGGKGKEYDFSVYNIVKYFQLLMDNNPNIVDSIFVPQNCIIHMSAVGEMVRTQRRIFLHKGAFYKFKGYAYSQLHKMQSKNPEGKRKAIREKHGYDIKCAYHLVRLCDECEQILEHGDINLQRSKEHLKAIRRGDIPEEEIVKWFNDKERHLENLYHTSKLQYSPDEYAIKTLLLECLESIYGSIDKLLYREKTDAETILRQIRELVN